jgi:hypothetical protein
MKEFEKEKKEGHQPRDMAEIKRQASNNRWSAP